MYCSVQFFRCSTVICRFYCFLVCCLRHSTDVTRNFKYHVTTTCEEPHTLPCLSLRRTEIPWIPSLFPAEAFSHQPHINEKGLNLTSTSKLHATTLEEATLQPLSQCTQTHFTLFTHHANPLIHSSTCCRLTSDSLT
jgi:hypothetical protein